MKQSLQVHQDGKHIYDIVFEQSFDLLSKQLTTLGYDRKTKILIVTDSNVAPIYLDVLRKELEQSFPQIYSHVLEAGEAHKNLDSVAGIYETLIQQRFNRNDLMIALGGGVVGDMTGFAAATFLRGIDFVQIPTTLLAMVDSSVGGKTGVDYQGYKNMIGAFNMPKLVYMNTTVLKTLPQREISCGMAEVIKYGYIFDAPFIDELADACLDENFLTQYAQSMVYRCCDHKRRIVEEDPTEHGVRTLLNYGHTIGHAIEKLENFTLLHGECVAVGMCAASYISRERGVLTESEYQDVLAMMRRYQLPTQVSGDFKAVDVLEAMKSDKKVLSGLIRMVLLTKIGDAYVDVSCTEEEILAAVESVLEEEQA